MMMLKAEVRSAEMTKPLGIYLPCDDSVGGWRIFADKKTN